MTDLEPRGLPGVPFVSLNKGSGGLPGETLTKSTASRRRDTSAIASFCHGAVGDSTLIRNASMSGCRHGTTSRWDGLRVAQSSGRRCCAQRMLGFGDGTQVTRTPLPSLRQ